LIEACKKAVRFIPAAPGLFLFDLIGQTFERFVETEKSAIDLAVEQSHAVVGRAKQRGTSASKVAAGVTSLFKQSVEHSVAAQRKLSIIMRSSTKRPAKLPSSSSASPATLPPRPSKVALML
jgi:hypothetical protein